MRDAWRQAVKLSPEEAKLVEFLKSARSNPLGYFKKCLKVVAKNSQMMPFELNVPQQIIWAKLEAQKQQFGMVRAMILKARKQGASTLVGARFYTKARLHAHRRAVVMAHVVSSAKDLFNMVQTYHRNDPLALQAERSSAQEFRFSNGSSYNVATAGSGETGRGSTPTMAHLSEAAFYPDAAKTFAGFVSAIPTAENTEIIVESTANGMGGEFHSRWVRAEAGVDNESLTYTPIFIPWYVSDEYRMDPPSDFELSTDPEGDGLPSERDVAEMYALDNAQMAWRRFYLQNQLNGNVQTFFQEFPSTPAEAFQVTGMEPFIKPIFVQKARHRQDIQPHGPRILGVDPAGHGGDKFMMALRQGHVLLWQKGRAGVEPGEEQVEWVAEIMRSERVDQCNVDYSGGWGTSLIAGLKERHPDLADRTFTVDFGSRAQAKMINPHRPGPRNRRAEMYLRAREWFELPEGVSIPDDSELQSDLMAIGAKISGQSTDILLESKADIRKRLGRSPDCADSFVLTFAFPDTAVTSDLTRPAISSKSVFTSGSVAPIAATYDHGHLTRTDSGGGWML